MKTDHTDWPHFTAAQVAADALRSAGFEAYIIGGAVRDLLLERTPKDFDLVTNATPEQVLKIKQFQKPHYKDTSQAYGVTRVYVPLKDETGEHEIELEIATYRRDIEAHLGRKQTKVAFATLQDDVRRRDFTVNALALDPSSNQLVDEVGGLADLAHQLLRFIGDPATRIREDPLRILRAIRLKNQLGFTYETRTEAAIKTAIAGGSLAEIASPRIKIELTHMLTHPHRRFALDDLDAFGALEHLLPELTAGKGIEQPPDIHAEGDVFRHSILTMHYLPEIINPRLAWAALLHDVGKPQTYQSPDETGDRIRFSGHYAAGAKLAKQILKRLHFGQRFREEVAWMIEYHLGVDDLPEMRPGRAAHFMSHPAFADLLELHKTDAHAAWSTTSGSIDKGPADFSELERIWANFQKRKHQQPPSLKRDLGIDGSWLIKQCRLKPGPRLGKVLDKLQAAYLDGEIANKTEAKALVKRLKKSAS